MDTRFQEARGRPLLTYLGQNRRRNRGEGMETQEVQITGRKIFHDRLKSRRNAICMMLMPREYFEAVSHLEMLNSLSQSGLV